jgi:hypothetical protein
VAPEAAGSSPVTHPHYAKSWVGISNLRETIGRTRRKKRPVQFPRPFCHSAQKNDHAGPSSKPDDLHSAKPDLGGILSSPEQFHERAGVKPSHPGVLHLRSNRRPRTCAPFPQAPAPFFPSPSFGSREGRLHDLCTVLLIWRTRRGLRPVLAPVRLHRSSAMPAACFQEPAPLLEAHRHVSGMRRTGCRIAPDPIPPYPDNASTRAKKEPWGTLHAHRISSAFPVHSIPADGIRPVRQPRMAPPAPRVLDNLGLLRAKSDMSPKNQRIPIAERIRNMRRFRFLFGILSW